MPIPTGPGTVSPAPVECAIEKLVHGGDGLARIDTGDGRRLPVFVPFTLPGERVLVQLEAPARGRVRGRLVEVLEPSPERTDAGCEYFFRCGGCQWQHLRPAGQLEQKRAVLLESLQRIGRIRWEGEVRLHPSPPWAYRNRIRLQVTPAGGLGYLERESHRPLPVNHCPIASPLLNRALAALAAGTVLPSGLAEIELVADDEDRRLMAHLIARAGDGAALAMPAPLRDFPLADRLEFRHGARRYRVSAGSFFQVNRFLTPALVEAALGGASGDIAVDLYSGVGLFALALADNFQRVDAVESHPGALDDLRANCAAASGRVRAVGLEALEYLRRQPLAFDLAVADPPRAGLGAPLTAALAATGPRRIHLVSCDPASLARDLAALIEAGYELVALHLLDLFPQTWHMETVAHLRKKP